MIDRLKLAGSALRFGTPRAASGIHAVAIAAGVRLGRTR